MVATLCHCVLVAVLLTYCGWTPAAAFVSGSGAGSGSGTNGYYSGYNPMDTGNDPAPFPPRPCPMSCDCTNGPSQVTCNGRPGVGSLSFSGFGLREVPQFRGTYFDLEFLDLSNNRISVIRTGAFTSLNLPELNDVIISSNEIERIQEDAFQLNELSTLDLSFNFLTFLGERSFQILNDDFSTLILQNNFLEEVTITPSNFNRNSIPNLLIFVANNPIPCAAEDPLAPSFLVPLCRGEFFGNDGATCIYETMTEFEVVLLEDFCEVVVRLSAEATTDGDPGPDTTTPLPLVLSTTPTSVSGTADSNLVVIGASIGGVVALVLLAVCVLVLVMLCCKLKRWERKFDEVTIHQAEENLRLRHTLNPYRGQEPLSPRYARGPVATLPPIPGGNNPKLPANDFCSAPPGVIPKIPPGGPPILPPGVPPKIPPGGFPRQFQNNAYDPNAEEIYAHIDERPLPSLPDEIDYGDNNYILTIASVPQKTATDVPSPKAAGKQLAHTAEITSPSAPKKKATPEMIESDHESDAESCASGGVTRTQVEKRERGERQPTEGGKEKVVGSNPAKSGPTQVTEVEASEEALTKGGKEAESDTEQEVAYLSVVL